MLHEVVSRLALTTEGHTVDLWAVILGGVLTLAGSVGTQMFASWTALKTSRLVANLDGKKDAYVRLSELVVRMRAACLHPGVETSREIIESAFFTEGDWWSMQARIEAYGSAAIRKAFSEILTHRSKVLYALTEWEAMRLQGGEQAKESLDHLQKSKESAVAAAKALLDSLNRELGA